MCPPPSLAAEKSIPSGVGKYTTVIPNLQVGNLNHHTEGKWLAWGHIVNILRNSGVLIQGEWGKVDGWMVGWRMVGWMDIIARMIDGMTERGAGERGWLGWYGSYSDRWRKGEKWGKLRQGVCVKVAAEFTAKTTSTCCNVVLWPAQDSAGLCPLSCLPLLSQWHWTHSFFPPFTQVLIICSPQGKPGCVLIVIATWCTFQLPWQPWVVF